jgi:hypothetical protein
MKQEQFYVAASRGRIEISIITSDVDRLRESLGVSSARPSATELAREKDNTNPWRMGAASGVAWLSEVWSSIQTKQRRSGLLHRFW